MRIVFFQILLLTGLMLGCDSVDPPKTAMRLEFHSWYCIGIYRDSSTKLGAKDYAHKEKAADIIKKRLKYHLPETVVTLSTMFMQHTREYRKEIENIEKWLVALGFQRITFVLKTETDSSILRDYNNGAIKNLELDLSSFEKATLEEKWTKCILESDELEKLWEISQKASMEDLGPIILEVLHSTKGGTNYLDGYSAGPPPSWRDTSRSLEYRKTKMADDLWEAFIKKKSDENVPRILLKLLKKADSVVKKRCIMSPFMFRQWCADAKQAMYLIFLNKKEPWELRVLAMEILMKRCDFEKYVKESMDMIFETSNKLCRSELFHKFTEKINSLSNLKKENANLIVRSGFQILANFEEKDYETSYYLALKLGGYVGVNERFQPDRNDERYKHERKYILMDTVSNALNWWFVNKSQYSG